MKFKNKMQGNIDMIFIFCIFLSSFAIWYGMSEYNYKKRMEKVEIKQEVFNREYIKENPLMIPVINAYNECQNKPTKVIEGCLVNSTKNAEEKQKLEKYLTALSDIFVETK